MKKSVSRIICALIIFTFAISALAFTSVNLKSISLNTKSVTLNVGKTHVLKVTLNPANSTQKQIKFSTSNKLIAGVDSKGKITALKPGKATITVVSAVNNKIKANCVVTVAQEKPVTLKWMIFGPGKQADSDKVWTEFNKRLKEKLPNTSIKFEAIPSLQYTEKFKLMMAAADRVDVAWSGYTFNFVNEVNKGSYLPLNELLAKYASDLLKQYPSWYIEKNAVKGIIYGIGNYQQEAAQPISMRIQTDFANKYLDVDKVKIAAKTNGAALMDELEKGFEKAKIDNALKKGIMSTWLFRALMYKGNGTHVLAFPWAGLSYSFDNNGKNVKVYATAETNEFKNAVYRMSEWYQKGYIRKDYLSLTNPAADMGKQDAYVIWAHSSYYKGIQETETTRNGYPVTVIPVPDERYYVNVGPTTTMTVLPRTCQNPERAIKFVELMNTEKGKELYNLLVWGLEGEHYKKTGENTIETLQYKGQATADSRYGQFKFAIGNVLDNSYETQAEVPGLYDWFKNVMHKTAKPSPLMGIDLDSNSLKNELIQITSIDTEYGVLNSGAVPNYKEKYQEYINKLKVAGIDKVVTEAQRQVDEFMKTKK